MTAHWSTWLVHEDGPLDIDRDVICLLLVHNEGRILQDFFDHHRALGDMHFVVVNDRSTDDTADILCAQPNLTLFSPQDDSDYRKHKRWWRSSLLDALSDGKWCIAPDVDERLIWCDYEDQSLSDLISRLEGEGAQAIVADMIDMYDDRPLAQHIATPERPLIAQFPYFDDPAHPASSYRAMMTPGVRFRTKFPMPHLESYGGMRDRLFGRGLQAHGWLGRTMLQGSITRPRSIASGKRFWRAIEAKALKPLGGTYPLVINKLALVKWSKGMFFNGGAHFLSQDVPASREMAAYLHFPVTNGRQGLDYIVSRGQHADGSKHYAEILEGLSDGTLSPMFEGSRRYTSSRDLITLNPRPGTG